MTVLDTDMVSLLHAGHPRLTERIKKADPSDIVTTTVITEAEVLRGRYEYLLKARDGGHRPPDSTNCGDRKTSESSAVPTS
jgi:hypothetical protein